MKGIVSLALATVLYVLIEHTAQSFKGIKMCQRDCELTKGCTGIHYDTVHLDCRLLFDLERTEDASSPAVTKRIVKKPSLEKRMETCSVNSRLIVTGQKKDVCVEGEVEQTQLEYSRLVVTGSKTYQVDLKTHVVRPFHFPWKNVKSAVFLKAAKRFVISQEHELFSTTDINEKTVSLRHHVNVHDMDCDEAEDIIFLKIAIKPFGFNLCKVNQKGAQFKCLLEGGIIVFAVDRNHKLLYMYKNAKVASYTYRGSLTRSLGHNFRFMSNLQYSPVQDVLYCTHGCELWKITMTGKEEMGDVLRVHQKKKIVYYMKMHGNYLYISEWAVYDEIVVLRLGNNALEMQLIRLQANNSVNEFNRKLFLF